MEFTDKELAILRQLLNSATFKADIAEEIVSLKKKLEVIELPEVQEKSGK